MQVDRPLSPVLVAAFNTVMAARAVHCVYQPIVALDGAEIVGYEALARGPASTTWATPEALVGYAAQVGRLPEFDWICRAAASRGALDAGLPSDLPLFINVEPASSRTLCPPDLIEIVERAAGRLQIVAEVTERSVASDPAGLLSTVEEVRQNSGRVALDDVGANSASQAMMSLVRPDVIKLDRDIVQGNGGPAAAEVVDAVMAEAKRTGAVILAEGIETLDHAMAAKAMGATFGQGWLFGRPGPLPRSFAPSSTILPKLVVPPLRAQTPFEVARERGEPSIATKPELIRRSRRLEDTGVGASEPTVLLSAFQHSRYFDEAARRRYGRLAHDGILTATFAADMPLDPAPRIRGCPLAPDDPLVGEWDVIVIGSRFAGALFAKSRTNDADDIAERDRTFDLIVSNDRDLILEAARPLLRRLRPI